MGLMPLAGDFRVAGDKNALHPLTVVVCAGCGLIQVRDLVPHSVIFSASYSYASSTVPGLVRHFEEYAREVALPPGAPRKRLLEVGCNDGVFLWPLAQVGYDVRGIDASENVVQMARAKGLDVRSGVFGKKAALEMKAEAGTFDVVTCSNVFAHNPEVHDFLDGILTLLSEVGEFWVEVHSARHLHEGLQWDCFYHEHCFNWSIHSLRRCLAARGLRLKRYRYTPMHGGAIRAVFSRAEGALEPDEKELTTEDWRLFRARCTRSRALIRDVVEGLPLTYAYGAAGRAVMLINWSGIGSKLSFVVDGSPLRYGRVIPNTNVPIVPEAEFLKSGKPGKWCFVTAHNYVDDIRKKVESAFPARDIKFVTPLPNVTIQ
jgi:SAM-dependent methyltransferase